MSSISDVVKEGVKTGLLNARVSYQAIVDSFDPVEQTITAFIAIQQIIDDKNVTLPILVDVPIVLPSVQGFHITMPIKKGDEVMVMFADRCIDAWFANGGIQKQSEHRVHHIADGVAIIGINSKPNVITNYDSENMTIRNTANNQKMIFKANGDIEVETNKDVNVKCSNISVSASGNASVSVSGNATMDVSGSTVLTAQATTVNSPLTVNGTITATGAVASAVSLSAPSLKADGVEMASHVHGGVQAGSSNTAPVQ